MKTRILVAALCLASTAHSEPTVSPLAHDIYKELVEINTTPSGDTEKAAKAMAARLVAGPKRGDLVVRYRGTGKKKPLLLMAHIDVVEAKREDWTTDPFKLVEKDGYYYGRGTGDDKYMAATWVTNLIRYKKEGYKPDRDLILVLETDEELSDANGYGITWLLKNHKDLLDAEFALNEGGGVAIKDGKPAWNSLQTTEKVFQTFIVEARNPGGHSSQPRKDNAIYELANGLVKLEKFQFPVRLNETTRKYFEVMTTIEKGPLAADMKSLLSAKPDPAAIDRLGALPPYNAVMRTTCVATMLQGGRAENALPQLARATVNCRILPGEKVEDVQKQLEKVLSDAKLVVTPVLRATPSEPSPLTKDLVGAIEQLTAKFWPGIPVVPTMLAGATDGLFLRNAGIPCYGHSGLASDIFDVRAHGKDERVSTKSFADGQEYLYELVKLLAGG